jgi:tRNA threonylcarbamoyladenosine biosynthesis protein TsaB
MKILAIEASGLLGSVALLEEREGQFISVDERLTPADQRTARSLIPTLQQLLAARNWAPTDVDLVAVTTGPGSFTGLRIGVVAAKTFAYAVGAQLVGVHTLAAIAEAIRPRSSCLWTILDAQRQELFVSQFAPGQTILEAPAPPTSILSIDAWLEQLQPGDAVAGPPIAKLRARLPEGVEVVDERLWSPSAAAVGRLGWAHFQRGEQISPLELVPNYYRKSAAEEKAEATQR